jgi:excisionase family DNA binding protein
MKRTLSTIEIARLVGVSVKSAQRWIDQEQLSAGRTPGGHRRVAADDLIAFLKRQRLPIPSELVESPPVILIVDSDAGSTAAAAGWIAARRADWEVIEARDGFAAGELFEARRPDVVILDLRMPGLDGGDVCRRIKSREGVGKVGVIAMAARCTQEVQQAILRCGAQACLRKPLDENALLAELETALKNRL